MYPPKKAFPANYVPAKTVDRLRRLAEEAVDNDEAEAKALEAVEKDMIGETFDE